MENILKVSTMVELEALQNHEDGELAFVEETNQYMIYHNAWLPVEAKMTDEGLQLNLYDLNKQIIDQLPDFGDEQWEGAQKVFEDWMKFRHDEFYMLYGREINYFTLFKQVNANGEFKNLFSGLKECITNIGAVRAFDITEDNAAIEIWIKREDIVTVLYLFEYDDGVVTYDGE